MPRGRGGRRQGSPGQAYSQRSDLNANRTLPVQAATGQAYGQAGAQEAAQRALPMQGQPAPAPSPAPSAAPDFSTLGMPPGTAGPGELPPLDGPTQQPNTPVMAGVDAGAGPGSEALQPVATSPLTAGVVALASVPAGEQTPQLRAVAAALNAAISNQGTP